MTRKTLDHLGYPRSTAKEAGEIQKAAERRREQMLPGNGPFEPIQEAPAKCCCPIRLTGCSWGSGPQSLPFCQAVSFFFS